MWRHKLRVSVSNAEIQVFKGLQRRGCCDYLETQKAWRFNFKKDGVHGTWIDFYWNVPYCYAVFIDGEYVHSRDKQIVRDELITRALEKRGVTVNRFRYRAPLRRGRLTEICNSIQTCLRELGETKPGLLSSTQNR